MNQITVGQNQKEMRDLALEIMQSNYKAADYAAKEGRLADAKNHLASAEKWRVRARKAA